MSDTINIVKQELNIDSYIIEGGKSVAFKNDKWKFIDEKSNIDLFLSKVDCINKKGKIPYQYEISNNPGDLKQLDDYLKNYGRMPLPPYIHRKQEDSPIIQQQDKIRYQNAMKEYCINQNKP